MSTVISSRTNPRVKQLAALQQRKYREAHGLFWAEGCTLAAAALASAWRVEEIAVAEPATEPVEAVVRQAAARQVPVTRYSAACFEKFSALRHPEGIGALMRMPPPAPLPEAQAGTILVLWRLQDPGNAGTLIRTGVAFGCATVVAVEPCVDLFHPQCVRASAGALFHTSVCRPAEAVCRAWLARHAAHVTLLAPDAPAAVQAVPPAAARIVVLGSEPHGLPRDLPPGLRAAAIPMRTGIESLNVTAAGAIALYEWWGAPRHPAPSRKAP